MKIRAILLALLIVITAMFCSCTGSENAPVEDGMVLTYHHSLGTMMGSASFTASYHFEKISPNRYRVIFSFKDMQTNGIKSEMEDPEKTLTEEVDSRLMTDKNEPLREVMAKVPLWIPKKQMKPGSRIAELICQGTDKWNEMEAVMFETNLAGNSINVYYDPGTGFLLGTKVKALMGGAMETKLAETNVKGLRLK